MLFYITTVRINILQEVMDPVLAQATKLMMNKPFVGKSEPAFQLVNGETITF